MKDDKDRRIRAMAMKSPGLTSLRRPATRDCPAFDLAYTRSGPRTGLPVVILPGGPGLASVLPYRRLRRRAAKRGIDTIMVEHRGVGLSRTDIDGRDLPASSITVSAVIDDIAAVLEYEKIAAAVIYGSSYGTYLACGFAIEHPDVVAAMALDSTVLSAHDHHVVRSYARSILWDGDEPDLRPSVDILRELIATGTKEQDEACDVVRKVYEFGGRQLLKRLLEQTRDGSASRTWRSMSTLGDSETGEDRAMPYWMEFGSVGAIAFSELGYAPDPDGEPFDPATQFIDVARKYPPFSGEPFDIEARLPDFRWPTVIIAGSRDLRTPRPIAERAVKLIPGAHLIEIDNGHSALDTHSLVSLHVIERLTAGRHLELAAASDRRTIGNLPIRGSAMRFLPYLISASLRWDAAVAAVRRARPSDDHHPTRPVRRGGSTSRRRPR